MIAVIDNGSQYTHVIWRSVRDLGYEVKIFPNSAKLSELQSASAFILSGGPGSAFSPQVGVSRELVKRIAQRKLQKPLLGICLGHQLIAHLLGGKVARGKSAEYGLLQIEVLERDTLFKGVPKRFNAWASHFDEVKQAPKGFAVLARSEVCEIEAMANEGLSLYSVQFHPEVWHTEHGSRIIANFLELSHE